MMSAQEAGLIRVACVVRQLVPPQLEAVIIVYQPGNPEDTMSSIMATCSDMTFGPDQFAAVERGKKAAKAFVEQKPNNPKFNPQS